jgi:hypothetical protein
MTDVEIIDPPTAEQTLALIAANLPFVEVSADGLDLWPDQNTHDPDADWARGDQQATLTLLLAREHHNPGVISWILSDLIKAGRFGAVEAAFVTRIACAAQVAAHN